MSDPLLRSYRTWLAHRIESVLAQPGLHAGSPAEAEITLLTLMEAYVAAWSLERGRSPDHDVERVVALWRAACQRIFGEEAVGSRLACGPGAGARNDDVRFLRDGMSRVWEGVRAMCPWGD